MNRDPFIVRHHATVGAVIGWVSYVVTIVGVCLWGFRPDRAGWVWLGEAWWPICVILAAAAAGLLALLTGQLIFGWFYKRALVRPFLSWLDAQIEELERRRGPR